MATSTEESVVQILKHGEDMWKLCRNRAPHKLTFHVADDESALCWESSSKLKSPDKTMVLFSNVMDILVGQKTEQFDKDRERYPQIVNDTEHLSFSLVTASRTLDFICEDPMQRETWVRGLTYLVKKVQGEEYEKRIAKRELQVEEYLMNMIEKPLSETTNKKKRALIIGADSSNGVGISTLALQFLIHEFCNHKKLEKQLSNKKFSDVLRLWQDGLALFNKGSHNKAIDHLEKYGFLKSEPKSIAKFLFSVEDLEKEEVGKYLGLQKNSPILMAYMHLMTIFVGLDVDVALRLFLSFFKLPPEGQQLTRIGEAFATVYVKQNPKVLPNADTAFLLVCSILMLNTDAHNPRVKNKMKLEEFVKIFKGKNVSENMTKTIYKRITKSEIKFKGESETPTEKPELAPKPPTTSESTAASATDSSPLLPPPSPSSSSATDPVTLQATMSTTGRVVASFKKRILFANEVWTVSIREPRSTVVLDKEIETADGFVCAYSVTDRLSFENVKKLKKRIRETNGYGPVVLVGCKRDLKGRQVTTEEGKQLASEWGGVPFFETGAYSESHGIADAFNALVAKLPIVVRKKARRRTQHMMKMVKMQIALDHINSNNNNNHHDNGSTATMLTAHLSSNINYDDFEDDDDDNEHGNNNSNNDNANDSTELTRLTDENNNNAAESGEALGVDKTKNAVDDSVDDGLSKLSITTTVLTAKAATVAEDLSAITAAPTASGISELDGSSDTYLAHVDNNNDDDSDTVPLTTANTECVTSAAPDCPTTVHNVYDIVEGGDHNDPTAHEEAQRQAELLLQES